MNCGERTGVLGDSSVPPFPVHTVCYELLKRRRRSVWSGMACTVTLATNPQRMDEQPNVARTTLVGLGGGAGERLPCSG